MKYSVLMSLYIKENPEYLKHAIQSMLDQTFMPDEIVIVKDGPITDSLQAVLNQFEKQYPKLFHIVGYKENKGLGYALNYGLNHCKNEIVARMDADDIALPDRCEKQIAYLIDNPQVDIVGGQIEEFVNDTDNTVGKRIVPCSDTDIKYYMKKRCGFNHMTVMFRKSKVIDSGSYLDWFWNEDYYLWIRMMQNQCVFANLGEVLVKVRVGEDMYKRRGGWKYFQSEKKLQKYMYTNRIINLMGYIYNVSVRFIVQVMIPNSIRSFIFKKVARQNV